MCKNTRWFFAVWFLPTCFGISFISGSTPHFEERECNTTTSPTLRANTRINTHAVSSRTLKERVDAGRGEKGMKEGLTGVIRPERNGNVIVTDGLPSRALSVYARPNRGKGREMKIYTEFKLHCRLPPGLYAHFARFNSRCTLRASPLWGSHKCSVYIQYHRPTITSLNANCFRNFCVKCAFQLSANQRFHD